MSAGVRTRPRRDSSPGLAAGSLFFQDKTCRLCLRRVLQMRATRRASASAEGVVSSFQIFHQDQQRSAGSIRSGDPAQRALVHSGPIDSTENPAGPEAVCSYSSCGGIFGRCSVTGSNYACETQSFPAGRAGVRTAPVRGRVLVVSGLGRQALRRRCTPPPPVLTRRNSGCCCARASRIGDGPGWVSPEKFSSCSAAEGRLMGYFNSVPILAGRRPGKAREIPPEESGASRRFRCGTGEVSQHARLTARCTWLRTRSGSRKRTSAFAGCTLTSTCRVAFE